MPPTPDLEKLTDLEARVVFLPVRHHSPACARRVRDFILHARPTAVLIEGPSDFNNRLDELALPHRLPIAIYSFVRLPDGSRRGAYYPFCVYSPEWQSLLAARQVGAAARFIDLPWGDVANADEPANRYADAELRRSRYVDSLCRQLGVEDFDALWDTLFEIDPGLSPEEFFRRCHAFCLHCRLLEEDVSPADRHREAFMAGEVRRASEESRGRVVVVTGGYHSSALYARLRGQPLPGTEEPVSCEAGPIADGPDRGISLTPYSYERLDNLVGYEAGMPNPGFYHQVWQDREAGKPRTYRRLLRRVVERLRKRGQQFSAADLIAVETTARALAHLRGHDEVWRWDLTDGLGAALVKDELQRGGGHPLLEVVHEVFRGGERGRLAEGAALPPLVLEVERLLHEHDLEAEPRPREVDLDLAAEADRPRSRLLHRLRILGIAGFQRVAGTDLAARDDLTTVWERWRLHWTPDLDATAIEAARYGPTLPEAAAARLAEQAAAGERDAEKSALLLLDACLAGLDTLAGELWQRLDELIRGDGDFFTVTACLGHLLYLYRYDAVLRTAGRADLGVLLGEAYGRGLWLLEGLGQVAGRDRDFLNGVRLLLDTFERCGSPLGLDREEFVGILGRVASDRTRAPLPRGAATGALWTLNAADVEQVRADLRLFADPGRLGDFLTGLFGLAREVVQRHPDLVRSIDALVMSYGDEEFLEALPALRLAFTFFTPREKHHLARTLLGALGLAAVEPPAELDVSPETAAEALAFEARLYGAIERFGLRGRET